ncbi:MAG: TerB N-terminal domain-containing protein [Coriobacteriia bacterium]|nr:TerB N-terminal domain-containing protein [Coriobacteriia bacterium]
MSDQKEYKAFALPPRWNKLLNDVPEPAPGAIDDSEEAFELVDSDFAEIEYDLGFCSEAAGGQAGSALRLGSAAQTIQAREADPIRDKFHEMRYLASNSTQNRNSYWAFYIQAKFMEDFTDDYWDYAEYSMYYPQYQKMSYDQLRTYFTWRSYVREGTVRQAPVSYVFLHIYELLCGIGVKDQVDGLERLMTVWEALRGNEATLDNYLPRWLKDYHIYYELPHTFDEFVSRYELYDYYPEVFLFEEEKTDRLELWNRVSSYNILKSRFYQSENRETVDSCFAFVIGWMREFTSHQDKKLEDVFGVGIKTKSTWFPFHNAVFYDWLTQTDRTVEISVNESYTCTNNRWTSSTLVYDFSRSELVGYLLKKMEACLRIKVGYTYKITAKPGAFVYMLESKGISFAEFDLAIEEAVEAFYKESTRIVVNVDSLSLAQIREEAKGTLGRLIVEDTLDIGEGKPTEVRAPGEAAGDEATSERAEAPGEPAAEATGAPASEEPGASPHEGQTAGSEDKRWERLREALGPTELEALALIAGEALDLKAFADQRGLMLEVLVDAINEQAMDQVNDNIVYIDEDFMTGTSVVKVYEEYQAELQKMVARDGQ